MTVQSTTEASEAPVDEIAEPTVTETTPAATDVTDQAATEDAPEVGTSGEDTVLERFKLEDIEDPAVREHVERYVKQVQGDYTRKTTTLAEQRRAVEAEAAQVAEMAETFKQLENEDTRDAAIETLIGKYGYTLEEAEAEADAAETEAETPGTAEFRDPRVDELLAQQEAAKQAQAEAEAAAEREAHNDRIMDHVDTGLEAFAEKLGVDELRPGQRRQIIAIAASLPRLEGDLPNMEAAIAEYEAEVAADQAAYLASKRGTTPVVAGQSGSPSFDPRDPKQRLAQANRVAEARLSQHR
jgi:hypothetical protein